MSLKNFKVVKRTIWLILSLIKSQFKFWTSFSDIGTILSRLMHLSSKSQTFILGSLNFIFKFFAKFRIPCKVPTNSETSLPQQSYALPKLIFLTLPIRFFSEVFNNFLLFFRKRRCMAWSLTSSPCLKFKILCLTFNKKNTVYVMKLDAKFMVPLYEIIIGKSLKFQIKYFDIGFTKWSWYICPI